jgi:Fe-S oxidoreductase
MKTIFGTTRQKMYEIPSGCCGMAGSFGYEKEHYGISQKIGEEILFPCRTINEGGYYCGCKRIQLPPPDRTFYRGKAQTLGRGNQG